MQRTPYLGWTALVDSVKDIFGDVRDGDWRGAFVAGFTAPAQLIGAVLDGTSFGGIVPALLNWLPQQFADAITPVG